MNADPNEPTPDPEPGNKPESQQHQPGTDPAHLEATADDVYLQPRHTPIIT